MPKSIDQFLTRQWTKEYDCLDLVCEAWAYLTGEDLNGRLNNLLSAVKAGEFFPSIVKQFEKLPKPQSPCIVLFRQPGREPHVGIFYESKVLHLPKQGVEFQPIGHVAKWYSSVEYYR